MKDLEADIVLKLRSSRMYVTRDDLGKACGIDHEDVMKVDDDPRCQSGEDLKKKPVDVASRFCTVGTIIETDISCPKKFKYFQRGTL